jgi:hypothetical protein
MGEADGGTFEVLSQLEMFFCSPTFTTALGDFFNKHVGDLDFRPLEEEQPLK